MNDDRIDDLDAAGHIVWGQEIKCAAEEDAIAEARIGLRAAEQAEVETGGRISRKSSQADQATVVTLDFLHDGHDFQIRSHVKTISPSRVGAFLFEQGLFIPKCSAGFGVDGNDPEAVMKMVEGFKARITSGEVQLRAGVAVEILS